MCKVFTSTSLAPFRVLRYLWWIFFHLSKSLFVLVLFFIVSYQTLSLRDRHRSLLGLLACAIEKHRHRETDTKIGRDSAPRLGSGVCPIALSVFGKLRINGTSSKQMVWWWEETAKEKTRPAFSVCVPKDLPSLSSADEAIWVLKVMSKRRKDKVQLTLSQLQWSWRGGGRPTRTAGLHAHLVLGSLLTLRVRKRKLHIFCRFNWWLGFNFNMFESFFACKDEFP